MFQASNRISTLLHSETEHVQAWLDTFEDRVIGEPRTAVLAQDEEYIIIKGFPLPDGYAPDEVDVLIFLDNFPTVAPIGLHVLNNGNDRLISQLKGRMNAFRDAAFHGAPAFPGYTWLCYVYQDNRWTYNVQNHKKGDNVRKFLSSFFAVLEG
jgi:hypothetical protein